MRRLGRGGMADVYLAEQESLGRKVAFKVLKNHWPPTPRTCGVSCTKPRRRLRLVHANIVQIHEVGCLDGIHFMVQEYVEGQNLKQLIDRKGTLDASAAVSVMRQVAAALHKAAQQKIIHRDIKPENIMLSPAGEMKVADFGLARVEREGQAVNLTQVGVTVGTPLYMSPEQVEGRAVDSRSDLYSFGVTCYQMLAGRPPFEGDSPLSIAVQHLKKEPPRLDDQRSDLPGGLCRIVHKLMAKRPEDRYPTALDVLKELRSLPIPGADEVWPADAEGWTASELAVQSHARTEVTQQLAAVMEREAQTLGRRGSVGLLLAVLLAAFLGGGIAAWGGDRRRYWRFPSKNCRPSNARRRFATSICTLPKSRPKKHGRACLAISRLPRASRINTTPGGRSSDWPSCTCRTTISARRCGATTSWPAPPPTCNFARSAYPVRPMSTSFATTRAWLIKNLPRWSRYWSVCQPRSGRLF